MSSIFKTVRVVFCEDLSYLEEKVRDKIDVMEDAEWVLSDCRIFETSIGFCANLLFESMINEDD